MKHACVFISATNSDNKIFADATIQLTHELVKRNYALVYGGANVGLMGLLANTALELGGKVVGVIPDSLAEKEIAHPQLTQLHQVNSMSDRKILLAELSDIFIIFPGGLGTLDELFEIWNAAKMGLHKKPIGILNIKNYFDSLISFINNAIENKFMDERHLDLVCVAGDSMSLLDCLK